MDAEAVPVTRSVEIENFLDTLFKAEKGWVYTPTKNPATGHWQPHFYQWPKQKKEIVVHFLDQTHTKDCYIAPALFKAPNAEKPAFKGSNFVWIEFDGNAPDSLPSGVPEPSIRIRSSTRGHEHWYWKLSNFESDYRVLEGLSKRLTYTLDADKSGWDAVQVLRPPATIHHDSKRRTSLITSRDSSYGYEDFQALIEAPVAAVVNTTIDSLPDIQDTIAKYSWPADATDLFKKAKISTGSRSSAMTRLGFHCIEMGMTNEECYVVLLNADDRWGKFKHRPPEDRAKRLTGIITHCRSQKGIQAELSLDDALAPIFSWNEFNNSDIKPPVWLFDGLLAEQGLLVLSGDPAVGKSTVSLYACMRAILKESFLYWGFNKTYDKEIRAAFMSFEMQPSECKGFLDEMAKGYDGQRRDVLGESFYLVPEGSSVDLSKKEYQQEVLDRLLSRDINLVVFDSLKAMTMNDDNKIRLFLEWVTKVLRKEHKMTVIVIHHNRKPSGNKSERGPVALGDVYGGVEITAESTAVLILQKKAMKNVVSVTSAKIRSAEEPDKFLIKREEHLQFAMATGMKDEEDTDASSEGSTVPDTTLFGG